MNRIGLTGGIASGKSTAIDILIEEGFKIIDSDTIVRSILDRDKEVMYYIKQEFGDLFVENGVLNKRLFGDYIFSSSENRIKYEEYIMPKIIYQINKEFRFYEDNGEKVCILDAPILIEKNLYRYMDYVVVVWIDKEEQLKRLMKRDNLDRKNAINRINAQMDIDKKKEFANFIIDNTLSMENLRKQIDSLSLILKNLSF